MEKIKKLFELIRSSARYTATAIYFFVLFLIMIFPPLSLDPNGNNLFGLYFSGHKFVQSMFINSNYLFAEIAVVSLIYFALMLFIFKK